MSERGQAIQRLLMLRQFPGFDGAELSELAILAENLVERTFPAGETVGPEGLVPDLHLVLDGALVARGSRARWGTHETFGTLEALAGRTLREPVVAATATHTLKVPAEDFLEILDDNFGLLSSVRRSLARRILAHGPLSMPGAGSTLLGPETSGSRTLGMVERLIILRRNIPFGEGKIEALAALARAAEDVRIPAGTEVAKVGELSTGPLVILEGAARTSLATGAAHVLAPGHAIGALETLGEAPFAAGVTTITELRVLRTPSSALFDVLEDHTELALSIIAKLARTILDHDIADELADMN